MRRGFDIPLIHTLQTKDVNKPKCIPFVTTFNPSLSHISSIIKKHYNLLLSSNRCKRSFSAFTCSSLQTLPQPSLLVTAKHSSNSANPQLPSSAYCCGKNCACPCICHGLTAYTLFSTGETPPIKSNLTCDKKPHLYDSM